jgi:hypothetical protein
MRFYVFVLASFLFVAPAAAQLSNETIGAYNEAVQAGNPVMIIAAAEALAEAAMATPDNDESSAMAFEAAWMLCLVNECENAGDAAAFAAADIPTVEDAYPSAKLRNVLASYTAWKADDSKRNREEMVSHLFELGPDDISRVSLTVHREHFLYCAQKGAWRDAERAATAAAEHSAAVKSEVFEDYALAKLTSITAGFNARPKIEQYRYIQELREELRRTMSEQNTALPDTPNTFLEKIGYRADAWEGAMNAYFISVGDQKKIEQVREDLGLDDAPALEDTSDLCEGGFDGPPQIDYPRDALRNFSIGSVIVGFSLNNGKTENVEVLAAVPEGVFEAVAKKAVEDLTWSPAEGVDTSSCSMVRENIVYPFVFSLD